MNDRIISDGDDLLSSILVGRTPSILRVNPTPPPYEVTSMKRSPAAAANWSGAPKRKFLWMIQCFAWRGMPVELTSLHGQVYDLGRIKVGQNEVHYAALEIVSELGLPSQNDENGNLPETMVEPNIGSWSEKSGTELGTVLESQSTSPKNRSHNMDDNQGLAKPNAIEVSGPILNEEFLTVRESCETTQPCENHLPNEHKIEGVDYTDTSFNEEWKPTTDKGTNDPRMDHMMNFSSTSDMAHASVGIIQLDSVNESEGTNAHVTDLGVKDYILPDITQDAAELIPDADHGGSEYHGQSEIYSTTSKEQLDL